MLSEHDGTKSARLEREQVQSRGVTSFVPATDVFGRRIVVTGRWLRIARIKDEDWVENARIEAPAEFAAQLRSVGIGADVFTFCGPLGGASMPSEYREEPENAAVVNTTDYDSWWNALPQESRKNVRRAAKRGLEVRAVDLDEAFARSIKRIYDESPIRQGRRFWHYGKDAETVLRENASYRERSEFLGAYFEGELVGFMKWVYIGDVARMMQILSLNSHQEHRPMNALVAKAVEICHSRRMRYLVYGKFSYGNKVDDSMAEFKRRMGFTQLDYPRYFVPLNTRGAGLLKLGLHKGWIGVLPPLWITAFRDLRARWMSRGLADRRRESEKVRSDPGGKRADG